MYRFTRDNGFYLVTVPAPGGAWRSLDGRISTHAGGHVVVLDFAEPIDTEAIQAAFGALMDREWGTKKPTPGQP